MVIRDRPAREATRTTPTAVVLESAAYTVRHLHVVAHGIELPQRHGVDEVVVAAPVPRLGDSTVVPHDEVFGIVGIDPHGVVINVHAHGGVPHSLAAVVGEVDRCGRPVDAVRVLWIHPHLGVVERPHIVARHLGPRPTAVLRAVQTAGPGRMALPGIRLDQRVHDVGVAPGDGDADATEHGLRKTAALHLGPGLPRIHRLPQRATGPAALQEVGTPYSLPARGEEHVGVFGVHGDIHEPRLVADELDQFPRLATVSGFVQPSFPIRAPDVPQGGHVHNVRVGGVDDDTADGLGLLEPLELPGEPTVGGLVDTAARRDRVAGILLARSRPHDHGVAGRDSDVAHGDDPLIVEHGPEGRSAIGGLPYAARRGCHEEGLGRAGNTLDVRHSPTHVRGSDGPPAERGEHCGIERRGKLSVGSGHAARGKNRQDRPATSVVHCALGG